MFKSTSRAIALLALALVPLTAASAQEDAKIVAAVPTEVADVVTGGSWSADKQGGFYRALVVMTGTQDGPLVVAHEAPPEGGLRTRVLASAPAQHRPGHASPAEDFVHAIRENTAPTTTLEQALTVVRISDALYASAENKRAATVS